MHRVEWVYSRIAQEVGPTSRARFPQAFTWQTRGVCRYLGRAKTHRQPRLTAAALNRSREMRDWIARLLQSLQPRLTAAALNRVRVGAWLSQTPKAQTRQAPLTARAAGEA